jgi:2-polyprenyl-6-methoxyphenol hydroxylase-like FAD-dependent oxidoreductase
VGGVDLGHTLARVLRGAAAAESLAGYQDRRRPVAQQVVRLTDRATRLATVRAPLLRLGRNTAVRIAARVPAARHRLVRQLAELPGSRTGAAPGLDLEPAARVRVGP